MHTINYKIFNAKHGTYHQAVTAAELVSVSKTLTEKLVSEGLTYSDALGKLLVDSCVNDFCQSCDLFSSILGHWVVTILTVSSNVKMDTTRVYCGDIKTARQCEEFFEKAKYLATIIDSYTTNSTTADVPVCVFEEDKQESVMYITRRMF